MLIQRNVRAYVYHTLCLLVVCITGGLNGFTSRVSVWRGPESIYSSNKYVLLFHDVHNYSRELSQEQVLYWHDNISRYKTLQFFVEGGDPHDLQKYKSMGAYQLLSELVGAANKNNCEVCNLEFRYKKAMAWTLGARALSGNEQTYFDKCREEAERAGDGFVAMKDVAQEFLEARDKVYQGVCVLEKEGKLPASIARALRSLINSITHDDLETWRSFEGDIIDYMQAYKCHNAAFLKSIFNFDIILLEIRALVSILETEKSAAVFMGFVHCIFLERILCRLGFQLVDARGIDGSLLENQIAFPAELAHDEFEQTRYSCSTSSLMLASGEPLLPIQPAVIDELLAPFVVTP